MGRISWIVWMGPKCHHKSPYGGGAQDEQKDKSDVMTEAERERLEAATLMALKMKYGAMIQGLQVALEARKGRKTDSFLEPPERTQIGQPILDFQLLKP